MQTLLPHILPWLLFIAVIFIEVKYKPRFDVTREGDVLLWYNVKEGRTYKFLFKLC